MASSRLWVTEDYIGRNNLQQFEKLQKKLLLQICVQGGKGLVQKDHVWPVSHNPCESRPLLLAA